MQSRKKKRYSSEKFLLKLTSNKYESDISLSRQIKFQHYVQAKLISTDDDTEKEIYYQFGYKLKDNDIKYARSLSKAKTYFHEPKEEEDEPIYQPLNHKFLFNTLEDYILLLNSTIVKLNDNYVSPTEMKASVTSSLNIRKFEISKNNTNFQKYFKYLDDLISALIAQEKIREEIDENICFKLKDDFIEKQLHKIIPKYITVYLRYLTLKKLKFRKNISKLFSNYEFVTLNEQQMKSYLNHVFDILISTAEIIQDIDNMINFDFKFIRVEILEKLNDLSDLKFIPYRWKSHICRFLTSPEQSWILLKANYSHLFIFAKNTLLGLSLINNNTQMRNIVLGLEIPDIFKETSIKVLTKEYECTKSFDFHEYYQNTLQSLKMTEKKEDSKVDVNGLCCILKDHIRCDIHYSRLSLYTNGYLCILLTKLLHLKHIELVTDIILNDYLFLIENNIMLYDQNKLKSLEFNEHNQLISQYQKISLIEILFDNLDQEDGSNFQLKLQTLIKHLLKTCDINLNILISCLFTLKTQPLSIMKRKSVLRIKIYKKLGEIHGTKSIDTINKIYICILLHSCIINQNKTLFTKIITKYSKMFNVKNLINIVISNTVKKDQNQSDLTKLNTISLLYNFSKIYDYLSELKPKTKVRLVDFLVNVDKHSKDIAPMLLNANMKSYFVDYIDSHEDSKFNLFLKYLNYEEYDLVDLFHIEADRYFKKFLDYSVHISNSITLNQLEYFKRQFILINFEQEFYKYLFKRCEDFITHLQIETKNMTVHEIEQELLSHSAILTLSSFILSSPKFNSYTVSSNLSFFLFYLELNKQCKSKLSRVYANDDAVAVSMISFNFLTQLEAIIEKFVPRKDVVGFLEKYKFTGFTYWYTDLVEFGKKLGLSTTFEKLEHRRKYELIKVEDGVFSVRKLSKYQVKKVYSLIEDTDKDDGVEVLNLFSMKDNSPVLNEHISTSPML